MSGRRLFVPGERLGGPRLTLTGPEHRHLGRVLRARPGDALTLFDGAGGEVEAEVVRVDARRRPSSRWGRAAWWRVRRWR